MLSYTKTYLQNLKRHIEVLSMLEPGSEHLKNCKDEYKHLNGSRKVIFRRLSQSEKKTVVGRVGYWQPTTKIIRSNQKLL